MWHLTRLYLWNTRIFLALHASLFSALRVAGRLAPLSICTFDPPSVCHTLHLCVCPPNSEKTDKVTEWHEYFLSCFIAPTNLKCKAATERWADCLYLNTTRLGGAVKWCLSKLNVTKCYLIVIKFYSLLLIVGTNFNFNMGRQKE